MAEPDSKNTSDGANRSDPSHVRTAASEHAGEHGAASTPLAPTVQRAVKMVGGGSPQAAPRSFGALLQHQQGTTAMRAGVLRQLQRSYGNGYVGEVLQSNVELEKPVHLAGPPANSSTGDGGQPLSQQIEQAAAGGQKLDEGVRHRLEAGLGADLSRVRVHTDARADRLARTVNATAFTTGQDIYFSDGAYQPETQGGLRLLAHEAAHTVQQAQGPVAGTPTSGGVRLSDPSDADERSAARAADIAVASSHDSAGGHATERAALINHPAPQSSDGAKAGPSVQRFEGAGGAPPTGKPQTESKADKDVGPTVSHGDYVLSKDQTELSEILAAEARKNGYRGAVAFAENFYLEWLRGQPNNVSKEEMGLAYEISLLLQGRLVWLNNYRQQLFSAYETSAKSFTLALLDESRKIIEGQAAQLGLQLDENDELGITFSDTYKEKITNEEEGAGLVAAAAEMFPQRRQIELLSLSIIASGPLTESRSFITRPEPGEIEELKKNQQELAEARFKYDMTRKKWEAKYPVLSAYSEDSAGLEAISRGVGSAASTVVPLINERLQNIKTVREGVDKLIWKEEKILRGAEGTLGVEKDSLDDKLIREHAGQIQLEATLDNAARGLLAVMLGLVAAVPTGGASLAASVAATAAAVGGVSLSVYQAAKSIEQYQLESAAAGTHFDKAKAISQDDPSLFWLALDIVAVFFDIRTALSTFKALSGAVRSAIAARTMMKEAEEAAKLAGYAKELQAIRALTGKNTQLYERILLHIGEAADAGKLPLKELEEAARAQYNALKESGRLAEIGDISEELFVKQMTSGARRHVIISGAEGVKRTKIITSLLDPNSPVLAAVLRGDPAAMDALLIQHGNWKQLISMLDQGTPEMRKAAAKLLARRAAIEAEVELYFKAKLSPGRPGAEAVSDVDRATSGLNAGKLMIEAEEHVAATYGKGWSEALRMNFYTEAARLTQYEKIMGHLSAAQRGALLARLTEETEIYNVARMLENAHGNEELLRDAKAYAERLKINIDDPRVQELLPQMRQGVSLAERNKLLVEVDDLMRRYVRAAPGSEEQLRLAEEITRRQMRANLFTQEAYIGPGAGRMIVGRHAVTGHEAYQAALSNIDMIFHTIADNGGDIVLTMRQYEVYKYMSRFAHAAELAGVKHGMLQNWKHVSTSVYKTERQAMEDISYLRPGKPGTIIDPDITDFEARQLYESWRSFSQKVLDDMKKIAEAAPPDWTPLPDAGGGSEWLPLFKAFTNPALRQDDEEK